MAGTRKVKPVRPCGVKEIAAWSGYEPDTIKKWRARHVDFPVAEWTVGGGPCWEWGQVHHWLRKTDRWHEGIKRRLLAAGIDEEIITVDQVHAPGHVRVHTWLVRPHVDPNRWEVTPPTNTSSGPWVGDTADLVRLVRRPPLLMSGLRQNDGRVSTSYGYVEPDLWHRRVQGEMYVNAPVLAARAGVAHREDAVRNWLDQIGETGPWSDQRTSELVDQWWTDQDKAGLDR